MDRQDKAAEIDALLIGALYGELTPADEARLTAHLDSHPTDRGALDDMKRARAAVRESRIFELQLDPPQAVSALLLQEAHRRAPRRAAVTEEKESWFFRFTKMFLAHPAMAAAAMLVLVVGVASTLYMKKGDQFAAKEASQPAAVEKLDNNAMMAPTATNEVPPADPQQGAGEGAAGSGYAVGLADKDAVNDAVESKADEVTRGRNLEVAKQEQQVAREESKAQKNKKAPSAIVVDTPKPQPKELDERRAKPAKKGAGAGDDFALDGAYDTTVVGGTGSTTLSPGAATGAGGGGASSGRVATAPNAGPARNAPAPPPPATAAPAPSGVAQTTTKPSAPAKVTKEAEKAPEADTTPATDRALMAWAKGQHATAVSLANKGDCTGAAKLAVTIQHRAPDYYSQFMSTDRALKKCQAYIAAERAEVERSKARTQKRATTDEAAPTQSR